jgi:predicted short-subunit dehydrogenase-like oxidoreductase (DUF2520 family)
MKTKRSNSLNIIGTGRLGTALGIALSKKGYDVIACVSRERKKAEQAARLIGKNVVPFSSKQLSQIPNSDLIFITTPDDVIEEVAEQLSEIYTTSNKPNFAFHTSGALSSKELQALKKQKISMGSLHPLISISDSVNGSELLCKAFYCIEGDKKAVVFADKIVSDLGGRSFSIKTKDKVLYHASAVMACGHLIALFDLSVEMLTNCGLNSLQARQSLLPLVQSTVDNLLISEPSKALTGTFARADLTTVEKHLTALRNSKLDEAMKAYILLGLRSLELARQNGKDEKTINQIKQMLDKAKGSEYRL